MFVALLRGVNVGGNNMISMSSLKKSFEAMGFPHVSTYINSGNIIFTTKEKDARKLEKKIEQMLSKEYQLEFQSRVYAVFRRWKNSWRVCRELDQRSSLAIQRDLPAPHN